MTSTCLTPCMHAPQQLRVELEQRISTNKETLEKAVRYAARRMNASTVWQLSGMGAETRATNSSKLQTLAHLSLHSSLFEAPPRAIQIRHDRRRQTDVLVTGAPAVTAHASASGGLVSYTSKFAYA